MFSCLGTSLRGKGRKRKGDCGQHSAAQGVGRAPYNVCTYCTVSEAYSVACKRDKRCTVEADDDGDDVSYSSVPNRLRRRRRRRPSISLTCQFPFFFFPFRCFFYRIKRNKKEGAFTTYVYGLRQTDSDNPTTCSDCTAEQ